MKIINLIKYYWHGKNKLRYLHWRSGFIEQHSIEGFKRCLDGLYTYNDIKLGDIKRKQGEIVIIGLEKLDWLDFNEYISYTHSIDKIETKGIYTNIYFDRKYYNELIKHINANTTK